MATVGEILRRERQRQGLDVPHLAEQTRIRARFLEALEADDFDSLPGKFFARSFAQQYASKLGLSQQEVGAALDRQLGTVEPEMPAPPAVGPHTVPPLAGMETEREDRRWPFSVALLLLVLAGCSGVYLLWQRYTTPGGAMAGNTPVPTPTLAMPAPTPETTVTPAPSAAAESPASSPVSPTPSPSPTSPSSAVLASSGGDKMLEVTAKEDSWVHITVDGKTVFINILRGGESRSVAVQDAASVRCGNAGGIEVKWRGNSIGPVGPRGQIRTIQFTGDSFQIVEPVKKPAEPPPPAQNV